MKHEPFPAALLLIRILFTVWLVAANASTGAASPSTTGAGVRFNYEAPGPHAVVIDSPVWRDASRNRDVAVKIYAPAPTKGQHPLPTVVFSHGLGESRDTYAYLGRHWASHGFITIITNHDGSDKTALHGGKRRVRSSGATDRIHDLQFVLNRLRMAKPGAQLLEDRVDTDRIGVAGHSAGSTTALSMVGLEFETSGTPVTFRDPIVKLAIAMSPQVDIKAGRGADTMALYPNSWQAIDVPVMMMTGTRDYGITPKTRRNADVRYEAFEDLRGPDKYYINIVDAEHHAFSDTPPFYKAGPRDPRHHDWILAATTAFLMAYLDEDTAALAWLRDDGIGDLSTALARLEMKGVSAASTVAPGKRNFSEVTRFIETVLERARLQGAAMVILGPGGEVYYEEYFGNWTPSKSVPVASASKWWAAATIMTLVDAGLIQLDDQISDYLPEFHNKGTRSEITIRQTLAFTSGYTNHIREENDPDISVRDVAGIMSSMDLMRDPGTAFIYGGLQMQLAGAVAEIVAEKPYHDIFETNIVKPLDLRDTRLGNMRNRRPGDMVYRTENPMVGGGIVTSVRDFKKFLTMLLDGGQYAGRKVLSAQAIEELTRDQTAGLELVRTIQEDDSYHYSLGAWFRVIPVKGEVILMSNGALGTRPWINVTKNYAALFMTLGRSGQVTEYNRHLTDLVTDVMDGDSRSFTHYFPSSRQTGQRVAPLSNWTISPSPSGSDMAILFQRMDTDGDGNLKRSEIPPSAQRLAKNFDRIDRNGDGTLVQAELEAVMGSVGSQGSQSLSSSHADDAPAPPVGDNARRFERLDRNGDGVLDRAEIPSRAKRLTEKFDHIDRDGDGRLTQSELERVMGSGATASRPSTHPAPTTSTPAEPVLLADVQPVISSVTSEYADGPLRITEIDNVVLKDDQRGKDLQLRIVVPADPGSYPVILFSHASGGTREGYDALIHHWASHGYVCLLADHGDSPAVGGERGPAARRAWRDRPLDISFIIDSLGVLEDRLPEIAGKLNARRIGVGGHFIGAFTAGVVSGMTMAGEKSFKDDRVDAVLLLSPEGTGQGVSSDAWKSMTIPMLNMTGSKDYSRRTGNPPEWRTEPYRYAPSGDKYLVWVTDLDARYGGMVDGKPGGFGGPEHVGYTQSVTLAFWDAYLKGLSDQKEFLRSGRLGRSTNDIVSISWK